jgi:hypothetical protein
VDSIPGGHRGKALVPGIFGEIISIPSNKEGTALFRRESRWETISYELVRV